MAEKDIARKYILQWCMIMVGMVRVAIIYPGILRYRNKKWKVFELCLTNGYHTVNKSIE